MVQCTLVTPPPWLSHNQHPRNRLLPPASPTKVPFPLLVACLLAFVKGSPPDSVSLNNSSDWWAPGEPHSLAQPAAGTSHTTVGSWASLTLWPDMNIP